MRARWLRSKVKSANKFSQISVNIGRRDAKHRHRKARALFVIGRNIDGSVIDLRRFYLIISCPDNPFWSNTPPRATVSTCWFWKLKNLKTLSKARVSGQNQDKLKAIKLGNSSYMCHGPPFHLLQMLIQCSVFLPQFSFFFKPSPHNSIKKWTKRLWVSTTMQADNILNDKFLLFYNLYFYIYMSTQLQLSLRSCVAKVLPLIIHKLICQQIFTRFP